MTVFRFCADFFFWQEAEKKQKKKRKKRRKTASFFVWDPISYRVLRQSIRCNKRLCLRSD